GGHIFPDQRTAADHGMLSDVDKLVACGESTEDGMIPDVNMSRQADTVCNNAILANHTIVRHMDIGHHQSAVTDFRDKTCLGTAVERTIFTDGDIVSDFQSGIFSTIFQVLWDRTDDGTREDPAVLSDAGTFHDADV